MTTPSSKHGFFSWLGRQVGHVTKAVREEDKEPPPATSNVIYRTDRVEEKEMPNQPGVKLRRTVVDEVIVQKSPELQDKTGGSSPRD